MNAINTPTYMRLRDQLRTDIVTGIWPLGSHVTLAQLANYYEVSANPVREALLQLQGEGVVAMRMNRGAVIPTVDEKYIDDLYRVRGALQSMLVREAARVATKQQIETMYKLCAEYQTKTSSTNSIEIVVANRNLHQYIDSIPGNTIATEMLDGRSSLVDAFRRSVGYGDTRTDQVLKQHRKIVDAIAAKDGDKAAQLTLEHTNSSREDLLRAFLKTQES